MHGRLTSKCLASQLTPFSPSMAAVLPHTDVRRPRLEHVTHVQLVGVGLPLNAALQQLGIMIHQLSCGGSALSCSLDEPSGWIAHVAAAPKLRTAGTGFLQGRKDRAQKRHHLHPRTCHFLACRITKLLKLAVVERGPPSPCM